jgi:maltose O-acetyltransferase
VLRKLYKKILKTCAKNIIWYKWRNSLLRMCGFSIGKDVYIAEGLIIVEELSDRDHLIIGDRASFAPNVILVTSSHPNDSRIRDYVPTPRGKVVIEEDAWIGAGAIILPNVTVGKGSVVAAGAVVNKDVEPYTIVGGTPARKLADIDIPPDERW